MFEYQQRSLEALRAYNIESDEIDRLARNVFAYADNVLQRAIQGAIPLADELNYLTFTQYGVTGKAEDVSVNLYVNRNRFTKKSSEIYVDIDRMGFCPEEYTLDCKQRFIAYDPTAPNKDFNGNPRPLTLTPYQKFNRLQLVSEVLTKAFPLTPIT